MDRRSFLLAAGCSVSSLQSAPTPVKRPNILLVIMDDFGVGQFAPAVQKLSVEQMDPALLGFVRQQKKTYTPEQALDFAKRAMPTLLELSRAGATFRNAFAPSNVCAPARAGILTARLPNRHGMYENDDTETTGFAPGTMLAPLLQKAGYATGSIGKWHVGPRDAALANGEYAKTAYLGSVKESHHPLNNGFDSWFGYNHWVSPFYNAENIWNNHEYAGKQPRYNTELFADKALAFIQQAREKQKPFFLHLAFQAVHNPLNPKAPDEYFNKFPSDNFDLSNFYAHVNAVDTAIGRIRTALGPEWDNTLLLFCGDNGAPVDVSNPLPGNAPYTGQKGMFREGGIRVPLLIHWPAKWRGGAQDRTELVSTMDLMPTALEAAGLAVPKDLDGRSLVGLLSGTQTKVHDHLLWAGIHARYWGFLHTTIIGGVNSIERRNESPAAGVITDGRYLLRYVTATPAGLFTEVQDGAPSRWEMYDLREDPQEAHNIIGQLPQVAAQLQKAFYAQARHWPPPTHWRQDRWRELMAGAEIPMVPSAAAAAADVSAEAPGTRRR